MGAPGGNRTPDPQLRRLLLYPTELLALRKQCGALESGRPDLNRGPPAPKAGAIPGYATPREPSNVSESHTRINCSAPLNRDSINIRRNRLQQRAKRATAVAHPLLLGAIHLAKRTTRFT